MEVKEVDKLLLENLKEAIRVLHRYMVVGLAAAGSILALASTSSGEPVPVAGLVTPVPFGFAFSIFVGAYWVFGLLATLIVSRANRIIVMFEERGEGPDDRAQRTELLRATLTLPSIPTIKVYGPRIGLSLLPPILAVIGMVFVFGSRLLGYWPLFGLLMLVAPYVHLAWELRTAVGGGSPDFYGD